jgi:hypothetical protein
MSNLRYELPPPPGHEASALVGSGREGLRWERGDGLAVRLAAPERDRGIERGRLSMLGVLIAYLASGEPSR